MDMTDKNIVFFQLPLILRFIRIQVVQPPFPALFGSAIKVALRTNVKFLSKFTPLVLVVLVSE
jgi:hypothetical protein